MGKEMDISYHKPPKSRSLQSENFKILSEKSKIPILTRKSDVDKLKKTAKKCFEKDVLASDLYSLATNKRLNENNMLIV